MEVDRQATCVTLQETDPVAQRHIARVQAEQDEQYLALRRRAQGLFTALKGRTGIRTPEEMDRIFQETQAKYDTGAFLAERLGTSAYLDPELVSLLIHLRRELLSEITHPNTADRMHIDMAVLAYRNCLRVQSLINNCLMETERQLFGQLSLNDVVGEVEASQVTRLLEDVQQKLLPLLDRCQRMMTRALDRLGPRRREHQTSVSIGIAGQVNVTNG